MMCTSLVSADMHARYQPASWLFGLSLKDYEMKGEEGLNEDPQPSELNSEPADNDDFQALLNGDQEILMFNAEQPPADSDDKTEELAKPRNFYTIDELKQHKFDFGTYETEGYVVYADQCVCPPRTKCEPCAEKHIIISATKNESPEYQPSPNDLMIFIGTLGSFEVGMKYRFIVQVLDVKTASQDLNNIKLIYFKKVSS
jgi:hypothetical protein